MCKSACIFKGLLAWAAGLALAVLLVLAIHFTVDLLLSKPLPPPQAPAATPQPAPSAPAPLPVAEPEKPQAQGETPTPAALAPAPVAAAVEPPAAADPLAAGKKVFAQCKACHSTEPGKNLVGPSLAGVVGRNRGSVAGFKYTEAMAASHEPWTEAAISKYLADPKAAIPGNKMGFKGLASPDDRAAVIAYLKSLGAK